MIAAAGSGQRLGAGGPKALVTLAGRPMVEWSIEACRAAASIGAIVVAAPPGEEERVGALGADVVVTGAETRSGSVAAALERVETELVAIHDAARPLASPELFDAVLGELADSDAAGVIAAVPVADTIKEVEEGGAIARTVDRSALWAAQTPQAFRTAALREALERAGETGATDEAMLLEGAGMRVLVHEATGENLKVTAPDGLRVAELLLRSR